MPQVITKGYRQLVDEANAVVEEIDIDAAKALFGRDDVQFVDIRDIRELEREGRVPGAFHCPRGMLEFWIDRPAPMPSRNSSRTSSSSSSAPAVCVRRWPRARRRRWG